MVCSGKLHARREGVVFDGAANLNSLGIDAALPEYRP